MTMIPLAACATGTQWGRPNLQAAYSTGYERGERAGDNDARRGDQFQFSDEADYRNASRTRPRDNFEVRYREEFLRGFEAGYRNGYGYSYSDSPRGNRSPGPPPWSNGRGNGPGTGRGRGGYGYDAAARYGYDDGYEAGVNDARSGRRFDPLSEIRYREGNRGYEREYGSREDYRDRYREAFKQGYEQGYRRGR
jgi:hypothetical protein